MVSFKKKHSIVLFITVLDLYGKVLVAGGLQQWLLWEAARGPVKNEEQKFPCSLWCKPW